MKNSCRYPGTYVFRMPKHYVADDCVQVMVAHQEYMTMFDKNGVLYQYSTPPQNGINGINVNKNGEWYFPGIDINVNKYLNDDRRFQFPYHDIPEHVEKTFWREYRYANQILNYGESYLTISDYCILEKMAIIDRGEALVINNVLPINRRTIIVDREGLENLFKKDKDTYILRIDGAACSEDYSFDIATEDNIVKNFKRIMKNSQKSLTTKFLENTTSSKLTLLWLKKNFENIIETVNIETLPEVSLNVYDGMVIVKMKDGEFLVQLVEEVILLGTNQYRVTIGELPMMNNKINIDEIRRLKIRNVKEPKISSVLNQNIDPSLIEKNRKLTRSFK